MDWTVGLEIDELDGLFDEDSNEDGGPVPAMSVANQNIHDRLKKVRDYQVIFRFDFSIKNPFFRLITASAKHRAVYLLRGFILRYYFFTFKNFLNYFSRSTSGALSKH